MTPLHRTLVLAALLAAGCSGQAPTPGTAATGTITTAAAPTVAALLPALADNVIIPTYEDLDAKAAVLDADIQTLVAAPTDANLQAARTAWVAARVPYELSEANLFGPVADKNLDPAVDSWPVDQGNLDKALASSQTLDQAFVTAQQPTVKGYHAIEYYLYANTAAQLTPRKLQFLAALDADFRLNTKAIKASWEPTGDNYRAQYVDPASSTAFGSTDVAFATTLHAMADICDEVANQKIQTPLAASDGTLEESHYSNNSMEDFKNNMRGVQQMYLGAAAGKQGLGLTDLVAAKSPATDTQMRQLITQALADMDAVPGTFQAAIAQHPDSLKKVQASVQAVHDGLQKAVSQAVTGKVSTDAT